MVVYWEGEWQFIYFHMWKHFACKENMESIEADVLHFHCDVHSMMLGSMMQPDMVENNYYGGKSLTDFPDESCRMFLHQIADVDEMTMNR